MGCSALCGKGVKKREVICYGKSTNGTIEVKDECGDLEEPPREEECDAGRPCEASDWLVTPWTGCEDPITCTGGIETTSTAFFVTFEKHVWLQKF